MLALNAHTKIYLAVAPADMRKHFDSLWALAVHTLRADPRQGALFVFSNKRRNRLKILYWDGTGVWVLANRLEKGRFHWPRGSDPARLPLAPEALTMLLAGIDPAPCRTTVTLRVVTTPTTAPTAAMGAKSRRRM
jgi:transposase